MTDASIPYGYCHCGCGKKAKLNTDLPFPYVYRKFLQGHRPVMDRFWSHVDIHGPDDCWLWQGAIVPKGYASFGDGKKTVRGHRFLFIQLNGPLPPGIEVCHSCDNRACCNPSHLYTDTHKGNMQDAIRKGRFVFLHHAKGETNPSAKLTNKKVIRLRKMRAQGTPYKVICAEFNISRTLAMKVVKRKLWEHVL